MLYHQIIPVADQLFGADCDVHLEADLVLVVNGPALAVPVGRHPINSQFDQAYIDFDSGTLLLHRHDPYLLEEYELKLSVGRMIQDDSAGEPTLPSPK